LFLDSLQITALILKLSSNVKKTPIKVVIITLSVISVIFYSSVFCVYIELKFILLQSWLVS